MRKVTRKVQKWMIDENMKAHKRYPQTVLCSVRWFFFYFFFLFWQEYVRSFCLKKRIPFSHIMKNQLCRIQSFPYLWCSLPYQQWTIKLEGECILFKILSCKLTNILAITRFRCMIHEHVDIRRSFSIRRFPSWIINNKS